MNVQTCAKRLTEQDRLLLGLMMEGYRNREIAGMLSITAGAVGVRIHRMAARMREIYNKLYNNKP